MSLLAAVAALALLTVLPGPDVAVVTRVALAGGRADAARTALGVASGLLVWGLLTAAGLAALLAASSAAYTAVKLCGAAYLVWLGLRTLWRGGDVDDEAPVTARGAWRTGFTTNVLNPKIAVFYTGVLPGLVPRGAPHAATLLGLVVVHVALSLGWLAVVGAAVDRVSAALRRPRVRRALDRVTGLVLVGFGVRVAAS